VCQVEIVQKLGYSVKSNLNTIPWVREQFRAAYLDRSIQIPKPFDGLDTMLLFSWVLQRLAGNKDPPFVLHYWDLGIQNILIDDDQNWVA